MIRYNYSVNPLAAALDELINLNHSLTARSDRAAAQDAAAAEGAHTVEIAPPSRILEGKEGFAIQLELPGVAESAIKLTVAELVLKLEATRTLEPVAGYEAEGAKPVTTVFRAEYRLPRNVAAEKIQCTYQNGLLTICVPKCTESRPRTIPVNVVGATPAA